MYPADSGSCHNSKSLWWPRLLLNKLFCQNTIGWTLPLIKPVLLSRPILSQHPWFGIWPDIYLTVCLFPVFLLQRHALRHRHVRQRSRSCQRLRGRASDSGCVSCRGVRQHVPAHLAWHLHRRGPHEESQEETGAQTCCWGRGEGQSGGAGAAAAITGTDVIHSGLFRLEPNIMMKSKVKVLW